MNKIVYAVLFASLVSGSAMAHCYKSETTGHCYEDKVECEIAEGTSCFKVK